MQHQNCLAALVALISVASPLALMADQTGDVVALEAQCEQAREARIKPLRDMEIAQCKADVHNEADYCERYWKDYGNAVRTTRGGMTPRMFDDLPICQAAFSARKALINKDDKIR
jgi:hypothetical protein